MPDSAIPSSTVAPDTSIATPPTSPSDAAPAAPAVAAPSAREAIAAKYEQRYGGAPVAPAPAAATTEVPAQGDPATAVVAEPDAATPSAAPVAPEPSLAERLAATESQLAQVTQLLTRIAQPAPAPAAAAAPPKTFVDLLRDGDIEGAENLIAQRAAAAAETTAVSKAVEMIRLENELSAFVSDLRGKNPDLLPLEELITARAARNLEILQTSGKIQSVADYATAYKKSVNDAAEEARKIVQSIRAAGAQKAMVAKTEVLSTTTVAPTAVDPLRQQSVATPAPETANEYFEKRKAANYRMRGLAAV
jgi:hypothetical protein